MEIILPFRPIHRFLYKHFLVLDLVVKRFLAFNYIHRLKNICQSNSWNDENENSHEAWN